MEIQLVAGLAVLAVVTHFVRAPLASLHYKMEHLYHQKLEKVVNQKPFA